MAALRDTAALNKSGWHFLGGFHIKTKGPHAKQHFSGNKKTLNIKGTQAKHGGVLKKEMIEIFALARYSPYLMSSYINEEGAIRWSPSRPLKP